MRISDWSSDVCSSDLALPRPGAARALPKTLSHADVDRLFAGVEARLARDPADPNDLRLSALVELLYGSGLRASELVSLQLGSESRRGRVCHYVMISVVELSLKKKTNHILSEDR